MFFSSCRACDQAQVTACSRALRRLTPSSTAGCGIVRSCGARQGLSSGIVYLYRRDSAGDYVLSQRLTANASAVTGFGAAMALAADGSILLGARPLPKCGCANPALHFVPCGTCGSARLMHVINLGNLGFTRDLNGVRCEQWASRTRRWTPARRRTRS